MTAGLPVPCNIASLGRIRIDRPVGRLLFLRRQGLQLRVELRL